MVTVRVRMELEQSAPITTRDRPLWFALVCREISSDNMPKTRIKFWSNCYLWKMLDNGSSTHSSEMREADKELSIFMICDVFIFAKLARLLYKQKTRWKSCMSQAFQIPVDETSFDFVLWFNHLSKKKMYPVCEFENSKQLWKCYVCRLQKCDLHKAKQRAWLASE